MEIIKQFKALSDPTRLRLLNILNHYELNVNEIVSIVDMIQSGVSRHLKILLESGLLVSRKDGSFIYYSANKTRDTFPLINLVCAGIEKEMVCSQDLQKAKQSINIRKNRTKRFFRTVAPQWDRLKKEVLGNFDLNGILKQMAIGCDRVADLGCGTGEMLGSLFQVDKKILIGVDSSPEMLEQARIKLPSPNAIDLRLGELENLPMKDQEVDTVIMSMVLYHIFEPEKSLNEVFRVLKPGGTFLLADFEKHDQEIIKEIIGGSWLGFEKDQINTWFSTCGFSLKSFDRYEVEKGLCINLYIAEK
ncbi:MAG: metalloregulator ArsR/SmtB family transcription factor [Desulfobacteraceae bacterium]|nr:metalloregulator ArsR/SmtB family transcription factor [Desulfobacteraceae bacterium]